MRMGGRERNGIRSTKINDIFKMVRKPYYRKTNLKTKPNQNKNKTNKKTKLPCV